MLIAACAQATTTVVPATEPPAAELPTAEPPTAEPPTAEPPTAEPPTAKPAEPVKLELWWIGTADIDINMVKMLTDAYTASHPNVTINTTHINWNDYTNAMPAALLAGNPPDLAFGDPTSPNTPEYVAAGQLIDLTDLAAERGWTERMPPSVMNFYSPLYGDRTYGIPVVLALRGVFYNKTIMQEIGGEIPQTLDELEALFEKAKAAGYTPVVMGNADKYGSDVLWQNLFFQYLGAAGEMEDFQKGTFLREPGVPWGGESMRQAMTRFLSWRDKGYINPDFASLVTEDTHSVFGRGEALAVVMGINEMGNVVATNPEFEIGYFNFPPLDPSVPAYAITDAGNVLILPKDSPHPEEAIELIDFLLSEQAGIVIANQGYVPAVTIDLSKVTDPAPHFTEVLATSANQVPMGWLNYIAPFEFADRQGSELQKLLADEITLDEYLSFLQETYDAEVTK
jgi:raffinose/stachyose/melibiose transport system substrate-binding protein